MATLTLSDTPRVVGVDCLRGPWDTVEDEQAERRHTRSIRGQGEQTRRVYARPIYGGRNPGVVLSAV